MTLGRFIDTVSQVANKRGIKITRVDRSHSPAFDTGNWTMAHVREAIEDLGALLGKPGE